ncbi:OmpA family protein [Pseudoxanthomonas sp.]|uniref:OmpA family protein n=1 Tax=Pseudoxanthomonas sp. TaxID=1871049 RepID=UPI002628CE5E|nr:OmpA family protein [Pseudoxanthomonas sp.]WDS35154.1 MAG: OmpA family protein [Pseudoxanthomonas sp.]
MNQVNTAALLAAIVMGLGACKKQEPPTSQDTPAAAVTSAATDQAASAPATASPAAKVFDVASLPVSSVALGAFPYIKLPDGYEPTNRTETADFDQVPLWTGDRLEPVEGKIWWTGVSTASGKTFSQLELTRNIETVVTAMGGQEIFGGDIPDVAKDALKSWPGDPLVRFNDGLGNVLGNPVKVFVVHRADRDIWINLSSYQFGGGLLIAETAPMQITAGLLPAAELKAQIDKTGKVALHVNFATDKTEILPDSQPQITQVVQLLKEDAPLNLAVNGYTDNSGDAVHNKILSEGRAKAVAAAITEQGIDAGRLSAAGFGAAEPVADNASEDGKAQNRRVELVKQ